MLNNVLIQLKTARKNIPVILNITVVGLLAGLSFCVQFALLPLLCRMDAGAYLTTMHGIIPTFTQAVKPLMMIGAITFLVRLIWLRPKCTRAQYWILAAFLLFVVAALITIRGHFPINHQLMNWQAQNPPAAWEGVRTRWNELNFWRFVAAELCFVVVLIPLVFGRGEPKATVQP